MLIPMAAHDRSSLDFVSDRSPMGRRFRILTAVDDCTRESLGLAALRSSAWLVRSRGHRGCARLVRGLDDLRSRTPLLPRTDGGRGCSHHRLPLCLGPATPMSIMVGVGRGAGLGVLVKNAEALKRSEKVETLVVDRTARLRTGVPAIAAAEGVFESELLRLEARLSSGHASILLPLP